MDTSFAKSFGAVELIGTFPVLARSKHARARLLRAVGKTRHNAAVEMLRTGCLEGRLGAELHDFFSDEIQNEARVVWSGLIFDPEDKDNVDGQFPVCIREYEGIYFVWALEYDPQGYFLSRDEAHSFVHLNWDNVREERA